ncbi:hypothetical protein ACLOJK_027442 [Asimina triloba]
MLLDSGSTRPDLKSSRVRVEGGLVFHFFGCLLPPAALPSTPPALARPAVRTPARARPPSSSPSSSLLPSWSSAPLLPSSAPLLPSAIYCHRPLVLTPPVVVSSRRRLPLVIVADLLADSRWCGLPHRFSPSPPPSLISPASPPLIRLPCRPLTVPLLPPSRPPSAAPFRSIALLRIPPVLPMAYGRFVFFLLRCLE